jgi:hypothetical protein
MTLNDYAGDESYDYPFDIVLTANEQLTNSGVRTDTDSDFILLGMTINAFTSILFSLQLKDQNGNFFSSAPVLAANYAGQGAQPFTFLGRPRIFGPGSSIGAALEELSGVENTIQILFRGKKRRVPASPICGPDTLTHRMLTR